MLTIFIFVSSSTFYIKVMPIIELVFENPIWGGGTNSPICKRPRENPAGSCQCSVDPVLSSHDEPFLKRTYPVRHFLHLLLPQLQWKPALPFSFTFSPQQCKITYS